MPRIAYGKKFYLTYHKDLLSVLYYLIFFCDLFWIMCETGFASYADDNTPYPLGDSIDDVIKSLEDDSVNLFKWFLDNQMKDTKLNFNEHQDG